MSRASTTVDMFTWEVKTPEDIVSLLVRCAEIDADFNGDNGEEYLWKEAKQVGYQSNAEYLANTVVFSSGMLENNYGLSAFTKYFASGWQHRDAYWSRIEIKVEKVDIPERDYKAYQGMYAICVVGESNY